MKIWAFGDSFTDQFETTYPDSPIMLKYYEYKGYKPKNYVKLLSEYLGVDYQICAMGGSSNESIFKQYLKNIESIKKNDILVFGWTDTPRFVALKKDFSIFDVASSRDIGHDENFYLSKNTIDEILLMRSNTTYLNEIIDYIKIITICSPYCTIINWSWVEHENDFNNSHLSEIYLRFKELMIHDGPIEDIITETNGMCKDCHYSENGHKILFNKILEHINNI